MPGPLPNACSPDSARRTSAFRDGADMLDGCRRSKDNRRGRRGTNSSTLHIGRSASTTDAIADAACGSGMFLEPSREPPWV
jgi:hypothetical protein